MAKVISDQPISPGEGILLISEGVDLVPANIALAGTGGIAVDDCNEPKPC
jgi:chromosome partitioning protein